MPLARLPDQSAPAPTGWMQAHPALSETNLVSGMVIRGINQSDWHSFFIFIRKSKKIS
jgi:hypothetical protein